MELLTPRQQDILHHIADVRSARGVSPTLPEIASAFSITVGSVYEHVDALRRKGFITIQRNAHRGIRLTRGRRAWKVRQGWRDEFDRRFGERLRGAADLTALFRLVGGEFPAWLEVDRAELLVYDAVRRVVHGARFYEARPGETISPERTATEGDDLAAEALRHRRPAVATVAAASPGAPERSGSSGMAIPILARDRVLGVLRLDGRGPDISDPARMARAGLAAAALAPALERAALHTELQREFRLRSALVALCRVVGGSGDLAKILRDVYALVAGLVDAPYFNVAVKDDAGQWWMLFERDEVDGKPLEIDEVNIAEIHRHEAQRAIQTRPYFIMHRTPEEIRALEAQGTDFVSPEGWGATGIYTKRSRSILYVPLHSGGEMIGYLSAQSYAYNAYSIRNAEDLILIGEYIGLALQAAWRRRQAKGPALPQELAVRAASLRRKLGALVAAEKRPEQAERLRALEAEAGELAAAAGGGAGGKKGLATK